MGVLRGHSSPLEGRTVRCLHYIHKAFVSDYLSNITYLCLIGSSHKMCAEESYSESSFVLISRHCLMHLHSPKIGDSSNHGNPVQSLVQVSLISWSPSFSTYHVMSICNFIGPGFLSIVYPLPRNFWETQEHNQTSEVLLLHNIILAESQHVLASLNYPINRCRI